MKSPRMAVATLLLTGTAAAAQPSTHLGTSGSWSAWSFTENGTKACYAYAEAETLKPAHLDHGRVSLFVRHLRRGKSPSEASVQAGYAFAPNAIRVTVDGTAFTMIPRGKSAWLRRTEREDEFVRALTKGRALTIEAVSKRGNRTSYTFSLKGFTAALRKARESCRRRG